jgi:hypothetical protein
MFDPNLPLPNANITSAVLRGQFNGLKELIDAISSITAAQVDGVNTLPPSSPANATVSVNGNTLHFTFDLPQGQEGPMGQQGPPFATAVVDAVNTMNPGDPATVGVSFDGTNVRFTFSIPRGNDGSQGPAGNDGSQGPPFAQAVVDNVTTLDPGNPATVGVSFDGTNVRFTFGIPRGSDGATGPPGEVTQAQLDTAINGTSANTNAVSTLDSPFGDPDMEALRQKLNEMILNGRR